MAPMSYFCQMCKREFLRKYMYESHDCKLKIREPSETFTHSTTKDVIVLKTQRKNNKIGPVQFKRLNNTTYYVSKRGAVYNTTTRRFIKPYTDINGYSHVTLQAVTYRLHRLVYGVWKHRWPQIVHHKDGDKTNNKLDNLEGVTYKEHSKRHPSCLKNLPWKKVDGSNVPNDLAVIPSYKTYSFSNLFKSDSQRSLYRQRGFINPVFIKLKKSAFGAKRLSCFKVRASSGVIVVLPFSALGWDE